MDNASAYGAEDCRFESCQDRNYFFIIKTKIITNIDLLISEIITLSVLYITTYIYHIGP